MHTSTVLRSGDFQYWLVDDQGPSTQVDFAAFCPHYHEQDRIGVVAPRLDTGVRHTGYALLALTTSFYDVLRQRTSDFFDYPHHFAFLDVDQAGVSMPGTRAQRDLEELGGPWSALDVWPDSNWILASGTVAGMLKKVFDWQINRLLWPEGFMPSPGAAAFPDYMRKILRTRLKTVYYYNTAQPTIEIRVTPAVAALLQRSLARLPQVPGATRMATGSPDTPRPQDANVSSVRRYRQVRVPDFLTAMQPCFVEAA
ncbi:hypothetical protein NKDENANG_02654 [Candidatus Entotheonellaceae bacterium PAL068K]